MLLTCSGDRARADVGVSGAVGGSRLTGAGSCSVWLASIPGARLALGTRRGNPAVVNGVSGAGGGLLASVEGCSAHRCRDLVGGAGAGGVGGGCCGGSAALVGGASGPAPTAQYASSGTVRGCSAPWRRSGRWSR